MMFNPPPLTVNDIRWGRYLDTWGPWHPGRVKFTLPSNPSITERYLAVVNATEGGSYDADNGYDRCIQSAGLIQECEGGIYRLSALLGQLAEEVPEAFDSFFKHLDDLGVSFHRNHNDKFRFFMHDEEVDTTVEQQRLFRLDSDGSSWDDTSKDYSKRWAVVLCNTLAHPKAVDAQRRIVAKGLLGFMTSDARRFFLGLPPPEPHTEQGAIYQASVAAYLSFAANRPSTASAHLLKYLAKTDLQKWSVPWLIGLLQQLTFGPQIAIYPGRYNAIRPVLERLYGIDLPDLADQLPLPPKGLPDTYQTRYHALNDTVGLQTALLDLGFDLGPKGADGIAGNKTKAAVVQFQTLNRLGVDGIVGPKTKAALVDALKAKGLLLPGFKTEARTMAVLKHDHIVLEDPSNRFWPGAIVPPAVAHKLIAEKVVLLPCNPQLFKTNGVAGFSMRSWGSGWGVDAPVARPVCPVVLYAVPEHPVIHFAARVMPTEQARQMMETEEGWKPTGTLRLITDTSQHNVMNGGMSVLPETAVHLHTLDMDTDEKGGWIIRGKAILNVTGEGYYGFALYGFVPGLRVAWLAITQTTELDAQPGLSERNTIMRFPFMFKRYLGVVPAGEKQLGLDTVPATGLPKTDNLFCSRFQNINGWPGHRIALGMKGPGGTTTLNVALYIYEESSGLWLKVPQTTTQLTQDQLAFFDIVCPMEAPQLKANELDGKANPGSMEVLVIVEANGPPPNGEFIFTGCFDLSTFLSGVRPMTKYVLVNALPNLKAGSIIDTGKGETLVPYQVDGAIFVEHKPEFDATIDRVGELYKKGDAVSAQTLMLCLWSLTGSSGGPSSTLLFKPGATSNETTVATWAEVKARFAEAPFDRLLIDPTGGVPTVLTADGVTDFEGRVTIEGANPNAKNIAVNTLVIEAGAQLKNVRGFKNILVSTRANATPSLAFDLSTTCKLFLDTASIVVHTSSTGPACITDATHKLSVDMRNSNLSGLGLARPVFLFGGNTDSLLIQCWLASTINQTALLQNAPENLSTCLIQTQEGYAPVTLSAAITGLSLACAGIKLDSSPLPDETIAFQGQRLFDPTILRFRYFNGSKWLIDGGCNETLVWAPGLTPDIYRDNPHIVENWTDVVTRFTEVPFSILLVDDTNGICTVDSVVDFDQRVMVCGARPFINSAMTIGPGGGITNPRDFQNIDVSCITVGAPALAFTQSNIVLNLFSTNFFLDFLSDTPVVMTDAVCTNLTILCDFVSGFYSDAAVPAVQVANGHTVTMFMYRDSAIQDGKIDSEVGAIAPTTLNFYVDSSCAVPTAGVNIPAARVFYFSAGIKSVAAAPAKAGQGHMIYDQATARFRGYNGTAWVDFSPGGSVLTFGCSDVQIAADTRFPFPGYNDTSAQTGSEYVITVPRAGVIRNLYYRALVAGVGAGNLTITVRKNGVDTILTASPLVTATSGSDTVNSFTVAAGDRISIRVTKPAITTSPTKMMFTVELVLALKPG